jgi:Zn-dependent protease with chaperone function
MTAAIALALGAAALLWPVPSLLAGSAAALRRPAAALVLWQGVGLATGLAAIGAGLTFGLRTTWAQRSPAQHAAVFAALALAAYLLAVAALVTARTLRRRRRHRALLDLVGAPLPELPGGRLLDSATPMAWCVPGLRPRMVLTSAALAQMAPDALAAVVAHERAHLQQRHDLVTLPFVAWQTALPFLPGARTARAAVALLVESLADDAAVARVGPAALGAALRTVTMTAADTTEDVGVAIRLARLAPVPTGNDGAGTGRV